MRTTRARCVAAAAVWLLAVAAWPTARADDHLLDGIYCGRVNCYTVLNVTRDTSKGEIGKAYRKLAKQWHPDRFRDEEAKRDAEERFKLLATAYEILRDDEERNDYNYMLDNPQEYYAHYYRYYRRRVAPKVDVRVVLAVVVTLVSLVQYYSAHQRYEEAIKYFATVPKYRNRATDMARDEVAQIMQRKRDGGGRKIAKSEQRDELERLIRRVIEERMDIKGSYAKPAIGDVLWVQLVVLPYTLAAYAAWALRWAWRFWILKQEYGDEEKLYLIRRRLGMGVHQFEALEEDAKRQYLDEELWVKENFDEWKRAEEEEQKRLLAENTKYKQYRRYVKNHGVQRMTFDDS